VGNSVVVESNGTNLNNGVVAYKFGNSVVFETIIEKGDDYIKYADGVLQCWGITNQQTTATQISSTGLYYNTTECSATFPVAFISNPVVSLTPNRPDSSGFRLGAHITGLSTTAVSGRSVSVSSASTVQLHYIAIGKWK
jgi:hypothetical protein